MKAVALILLLVSSPAFAVGDILVTTEGTPSFELHKTADNSLVKPWPASEKECVDRAAASVGEWSCVTRRKFTTVGACVKDAPEWPLVLDTEGRMVRPGIRPSELPNGEWGPTEEEGYILKAYPECWVLGWVPYKGEWHAPEGPPVNEPTGWPPTP